MTADSSSSVAPAAPPRSHELPHRRDSRTRAGVIGTRGASGPQPAAPGHTGDQTVNPKHRRCAHSIRLLFSDRE